MKIVNHRTFVFPTGLALPNWLPDPVKLSPALARGILGLLHELPGEMQDSTGGNSPGEALPPGTNGNLGYPDRG